MTLDIALFGVLQSFAGMSPLGDFFIIFFASYFQYVLFLIVFFVVLRHAVSLGEKIRMAAVIFGSMVIARLGVTELIRFFYHRPRPFILFGISPLIAETGWSFPSGHASLFFALAVAMYQYNKKWGILFFIAAAAMSMGRIIAGVHYPSDIFGGMVVGIVVARGMYMIERRM